MWQRINFRRRPLCKRIVNKTRGRRLLAERLEDRTVLSATFGSALSIGNGLDSSAAFDVAADSAGNSYVAGTYAGTVDFDLSAVHASDADILTARGAGDAYVAKYAPDDSLVWVRSLGGDSSDVGRKIAMDASGFVYVAGEFAASADFGSTTLSSLGANDGFVAKLDSAGNVQWAKRWGTSGNDYAQGLDVDGAGNVYALGHRLGDSYDILKFSPAGAAQWSKTIVDHSMMTSADLAVSSAGKVFVAGSFDGIVDFDPSAKTKYISSGAGRGGFVLQLDTNGKFNWVSPFLGKTVGSTSSSAWAMSVVVDNGGSVIVGGSFIGTVDFNPGGGTTYLSTQNGAFITKLNSAGALAWARELEGNSSTFVRGLDLDAAGNIYASGTFNGTVDLDPGAGSFSRTTAGQSDIYVVKLTAAGNLIWAETFGGAGHDVNFGLAVDPAGVVHLTGYYRDSFDFDPDPFATYGLPGDPIISRGFRLRLL
jgi:hypothetical protein